MNAMVTKIALPLFALLAGLACLAESPLPQGLMLNLDFEGAKDGLIPNKTLFPLHIPQGDLGIETVQGRNMLAFQAGQGLEIPHSSLLDPDGREWIVTVRVFALSDGLILSQDDGDQGYAIYLKNGAAEAVIRSGPVAMVLKEPESRGTTKCLKAWVTIELQIRPESAVLNINRTSFPQARVPLQEPLRGDDMRIRLGEHRELPAVLKNKPGMEPTGFTGAIGSLKILRQ